MKAQANCGRRRELYYFRDQQGLEVDFVVPRKNGGLRLIETKASRTATPGMAESMRRLADAYRNRAGTRGTVEMFLVHQAPRAGISSHALAHGVQAVSWQEFVTKVLP